MTDERIHPPYKPEDYQIFRATCSFRWVYRQIPQSREKEKRKGYQQRAPGACVSTAHSRKCVTSFPESLWVGIWVATVFPFTDKETEVQKGVTTHLMPHSWATRSRIKLWTLLLTPQMPVDQQVLGQKIVQGSPAGNKRSHF